MTDQLKPDDISPESLNPEQAEQAKKIAYARESEPGRPLNHVITTHPDPAPEEPDDNILDGEMKRHDDNLEVEPAAKEKADEIGAKKWAVDNPQVVSGDRPLADDPYRDAPPWIGGQVIDEVTGVGLPGLIVGVTRGGLPSKAQYISENTTDQEGYFGSYLRYNDLLTTGFLNDEEKQKLLGQVEFNPSLRFDVFLPPVELIHSEMAPVRFRLGLGTHVKLKIRRHEKRRNESSAEKRIGKGKLLAPFTFAVVSLALVGVFGVIAVFNNGNDNIIPQGKAPVVTNPLPQAVSQIWELTNAKGDVARVEVNPFTTNGAFAETSDSAGWWVYDAVGKKMFRIRVAGNIVPSGGSDKWTFAGMSGSGGGYQCTGEGTGITNQPFPDGTSLNGTLKLTVQSAVGVVTDENVWKGRKAS